MALLLLTLEPGESWHSCQINNAPMRDGLRLAVTLRDTGQTRLISIGAADPKNLHSIGLK